MTTNSGQEWLVVIQKGEDAVAFGIRVGVSGALTVIGAVAFGDRLSAVAGYTAFVTGAGSLSTGLYQIYRGNKTKAAAEKAEKEAETIAQQLNARVADADKSTRLSLEANGVDLEMAERENLTTAAALVRSADEHDLLTGP
jgi:hypothetical protein